MAQLAIPMAALGAMYIISNKNKKRKNNSSQTETIYLILK